MKPHSPCKRKQRTHLNIHKILFIDEMPWMDTERTPGARLSGLIKRAYKQLHGTPLSALKQIESGDYGVPYTTDGRKIVKVGILTVQRYEYSGT